ncbi:MAG: hypothetical protein JO166_07680 [Deltaproteobacteria bacterium]|nr:hypothetical protein [Deltaproteobacteria bacterium]
MSNDRQIAANRRNAQRSTGPRSAAGKARVSMNPLKHGLTAREVVLPNESPEEFDSFRSGLLAEIAPVGNLEGALAEEIVIYLWRRRRVAIFEAALYRRGLQELIVEKAAEVCRGYETEIQLNALLKVSASDHEAYQDAEKSLESARAVLDEPSFNLTRILERSAGTFSNLWRHEVLLSRALNRTLHELQRLQAARTGEHVAAPSVVDVNIDVAEPRAPVNGADGGD